MSLLIIAVGWEFKHGKMILFIRKHLAEGNVKEGKDARASDVPEGVCGNYYD